MMLISGVIAAGLYALAWKVFPLERASGAKSRKVWRFLHLVLGIMLGLMVLSLLLAYSTLGDRSALWSILWCAGGAALAFWRYAKLK